MTWRAVLVGAALQAGCGDNLPASGNGGTTDMTDAMAALGCPANSAGAERGRALSMFYEKWKDEALVVDKWFRVQATSWLPATLDRAKALAGHPAFDLSNPNRARALLHSFAMENPVNFHAAHS